jgi:hypothetical protein
MATQKKEMIRGGAAGAAGEGAIGPEAVLLGDGARKELVAFSWRGSSKSLCVVNDQPVGNPKRKV